MYPSSPHTIHPPHIGSAILGESVIIPYKGLEKCKHGTKHPFIAEISLLVHKWL